MSHSDLKQGIFKGASSKPPRSSAPKGHQTKLYMQAFLYQFVSGLLSVPLVFQYLEFSLLEPELSFLKL